MNSNHASELHVTAQRLVALSRVGAAFMSERDETHLFRLVAETARDLIGATFAALTLRPVSEEGAPLVPSEGSLFSLAAVVGVTPEQEEQLRRMPLGEEGLLLPIFRHGVSVLVGDAFTLAAQSEEAVTTDSRTAASQAAATYAAGQLTAEGLRTQGIPRGHPLVRSFLGAPVLDREGGVRGGLLLGHSQPGKFTHEDEILLVGLAAQAAVAFENVRWYRTSQIRNQELDAIFESIADGVMLVNSQGKILRENGAARSLREQLRKTPAGERAIEVLFRTPLRQALSGESVRENAVRIEDERGETHEYVVTASPLRFPTPSVGKKCQAGDTNGGAVIVWHDATEARRLLIEQRVRVETEARRALLQRILDELPGSVSLVRGQDARLVLANRAAATVWRASWQPGQPMHAFLEENRIRVYDADGHPLALEQLATLRAVQHGETVRQQQVNICYSDGTTLPVLVNAVPLTAHQFDVAPSPSVSRLAEYEEPAAIVVHQDVTALKEAEQLKDEFISIAAHELRTPMAILTGFVQTLLNQTARGKGPPLAAWQQKSLQGIDLATARLIDLAEDLLDVTRVQAGRLELQREPTDLVALARRVQARLQLMTQRHTLMLMTTLAHLVVHADPRRIEQVLSNLIGNAIKYSPEGGDIEVTIRAENEAHEALLSVRDQGIGIPLHEQALVFGRFARAGNVQAYGIRGTGLGLYLCHELIEAHGGRIWFESVEGQGSTFFVALPLLSQADSKNL